MEAPIWQASGTIYVGPGATASPTPNGGIWLMGPIDPNYASPPAGWLKCTVSRLQHQHHRNIERCWWPERPQAKNHSSLPVVLRTTTIQDYGFLLWQQSIYVANLQFNYSGRAHRYRRMLQQPTGTGTCGVAGHRSGQHRWLDCLRQSTSWSLHNNCLQYVLGVVPGFWLCRKLQCRQAA